MRLLFIIGLTVVLVFVLLLTANFILYRTKQKRDKRKRSNPGWITLNCTNPTLGETISTQGDVKKRVLEQTFISGLEEVRGVKERVRASDQSLVENKEELQSFVLTIKSKKNQASRLDNVKMFEKYKKIFIHFVTTNTDFLSFSELIKKQQGVWRDAALERELNIDDIINWNMFPNLYYLYKDLIYLDDVLFPESVSNRNIDTYGFFKLANVNNGNEASEVRSFHR